VDNLLKDCKVLPDLLWVFQQTKYESKAEFNEAIKQYQIDIIEKNTWQPDEIVINKFEINLLLDMDWQSPPDDRIEFTLKSENSTRFTALDLMFQLNNTLAEYNLGDYRFFEGLIYFSEKDLYIINLGS
jgi:hypothetical protein